MFAQLAESERNARDVALAVCLAIGVPRTEADQRLGSHDPADWNLDGNERMSRGDYVSGFADVLHALGTFDLSVELSGDQRRIADLLAAAITEIGTIRFVFVSTSTPSGSPSLAVCRASR